MAPNVKSSMKSRKVNKLLQNELSFKLAERVNVVDREYGFMRVTADKSLTPFPRASLGVDIDTLRARLKEEQQSKRNSSVEVKEFNVQFDKQFKTRPCPLETVKLSGGTPHPHKGVAVDPKLLVRRLDVADKRCSERLSGLNAPEDLTADSNTTSALIFKSLPSCLKDPHKPKLRSKCKRRVKVISPRPSLSFNPFGTVNSVSNSSLETSEDISTPPSRTKHIHVQLSFNERRRIFNQDEFTIAKRGKKMSDVMMPRSVHTIDLSTLPDGGDTMAKAAIDLFIRKQGFMIAPTGTLTGMTRIRPDLQSDMSSNYSLNVGNLQRSIVRPSHMSTISTKSKSQSQSQSHSQMKRATFIAS